MAASKVMYSEGYKYWWAYKKNNTIYYRCSRYKTSCPGRCARAVEDTRIRICREHNHEPEPDRILVDKFRKVLTHRAATETKELPTIYWEEASQRHSDAALLYTFSAAESAMRKARRYKQLPQAPHSVQDFDNILSNTNIFRIHSGSRRDPFYQTTLTLNDDSVCVIFMHMKTIETIGHIEEIHINDSMNTDPDIQLTHHLLIVHAVKNYYHIPILYAISAIKTQAIYAVIFAYIRENLSAYITPNTIMSDFDPETQLALAYTFPDASIKGFWFYYTDAILKYMKCIRLHWDKSRSNTSSCLRMLMVLPLLPAEYMAPGLQAIRKWAQEKSAMNQSIEKLCTFIEHDWLRSVGADKMSIFGLPHGVYNYVQHFNNEFRRSLLSSQQQQSIWHILECITHLATRTYMKCNKQKNVNIKTPNKHQKMLETIIKNATQMWCADPIHLRNPLQFLQLSSHCINDAYMEASQVHFTTFSEKSHTDDRHFSVIKSNSNRKNKSTPIKDTQKNYIGDESEYTSTEIIGDAQSEQILSRSSTVEIVNRSEPPPLAFFPKSRGTAHKPIIFSATEPPPLVPIARNFA
ncbi:uncharacterized protein LOC116343963 [Contarinia nasturtii]|uniref:uncharacterized protein LOC116343963 n=1 Tax=Contarinia nasturtii TaxID=265458 RepID=UPI0012D4221E|nr:uncharacterized protein LOC116343963 [Contarinia nasturtii]